MRAAGLDVRAYHVVNVALHLLNGVLLLALLRFHLSSGAAFAGALLWTLHPLDTEAVDYLTQRTELLLGTFYLGALVAVSRGRRAVAVLCCALGMACKESMVTAPLAVLLWERVYRYPSVRALLASERLFHGALVATWGVLLALLLLAPRSQSVGLDLHVSALDYAQSQLVAVAHYLRLAVWPHPLTPYYGPVAGVGLRETIASGLVVASALAAALALFWRSPRLGYPAVLFFLLLAPTSSFVPIATEFAAERRMYLPLAALVALAVAVAQTVTAPIAARAVTAVLAVAFAAATYARNNDYASAVTLWQSAVAATPGLSQAHVNLGIAQAEAGAYGEAVESYRRALELAPDDARAHYDLALALDRLGDRDGAVEHCERAVALEPRFEEAQLALARARLARGDRSAAAASLRAALAVNPDSAQLHIELAQLDLASSDPRALAEALEHARAASNATGGRDPTALHTLAAAEWSSGLRADALATQARAVELAASGATPEFRARLSEQLELYRRALAR